MRRPSSYLQKYGNLQVYKLLQSQAAHARWAAFWRARANREKQ